MPTKCWRTFQIVNSGPSWPEGRRVLAKAAAALITGYLRGLLAKRLMMPRRSCGSLVGLTSPSSWTRYARITCHEARRTVHPRTDHLRDRVPPGERHRQAVCVHRRHRTAARGPNPVHPRPRDRGRRNARPDDPDPAPEEEKAEEGP